MLRQFVPRMQVSTIYDIPVHDLMKEGVKGVITDLDNTLVGSKDLDATPELIEWLKRLKEMGLYVVIVSNNKQSRVSRFADPLSIPFIYRAKKPAHASFRRALSILKLKAHEVMMVGDQIVTDVLGGNRAGLYTILVDPVNENEESFFTGINRIIERFVVNRLQKKGLMNREEKN